MKQVLLFLFVLLLVACSTPPPTETPEATAQLELQLAATRTPRPTRTPRSTPTIAPTATNTATPTNTPTPTHAATPVPPVEAYVGAPSCESIGVIHDPRAFHTIWNSEFGCHWKGYHGNDPHTLDHIFGTGIYPLFGGEISYPFQTFTGAGAHYEHPSEDACMEVQCKGNGYKWLTVENFPCNASIPGIFNGANKCIITARLQFHAHLTQADSLTRIHSYWLEAVVCDIGNTGPMNCGIFRQGGHADLGRLNLGRGNCVEVPGDPEIFCDDGIPSERQPYRIHCPVDEPFCLGSWQTEGTFTYILSDTVNISSGYGVHFKDEWGAVQLLSDPPLSEAGIAATDFYCRGEPGCNFNSSMLALFRLWVDIPASFDNGVYDTDLREGYFSYTGYTDRYGVIVSGCEEVALDCVLFEAIGVPVGKARLRASEFELEQDFDSHNCGGVICNDPNAPSVDWIEYP